MKRTVEPRMNRQPVIADAVPVATANALPLEFMVEFAPHGKAVVYREGRSTCAFELVTRGKRLEVDFGHCYDPSGFGGGAYSNSATTAEEQRCIVSRVIAWLRTAGFEVDVTGQHDDRWCPSAYKK